MRTWRRLVVEGRNPDGFSFLLGWIVRPHNLVWRVWGAAKWFLALQNKIKNSRLHHGDG